MRGDVEVGLGQRHLDVGDERAEEVPVGVHVGQRGFQAGLARRLQPGSDPEPAGHDLTGLGPAEDPRDGPQAADPTTGVRPPGRARADVERAQLLHRGRGHEVGRQPRVVDEGPVGGERGVADQLHRPVPGLELVGALPRRGVQAGGAQHGGHGQLQVLPGQFRQRVLVADHLALLGELDLAGQHAPGLGQDGVVGRSAAATDGATPAVEEAQPNAVPGRDVAQGALGLVDLPL